MRVDPYFPKLPDYMLDPGVRWFLPDQDLCEKGCNGLLPALLAAVRNKVFERRPGKNGAPGNSSLWPNLSITHGSERSHLSSVNPTTRFHHRRITGLRIGLTRCWSGIVQPERYIIGAIY